MANRNGWIITGNGYLLCGDHARAWFDGGSRVEMCSADALDIAGRHGICADCTDLDESAGDRSCSARCDDCGREYGALGETDTLCDDCAGWREAGHSATGCGA